LFLFFFPILRYKIYFTKIFRNLEKLVKFTVEFFSPKISPIILVKKATSFVKKITEDPQPNQNDLMFFFKTNQKRPPLSATKKTAKCVSIEKPKGKKEKKEEKGAKTLLKFDQPITQFSLFLFGM